MTESRGHRLKIFDLLKLSLRVFRVHPLRTFLTVLGISVGIGTVLFLVSLGYGLQFLLIGKLVTTEDSLVTLETFYPPESNLAIQVQDLESIVSFDEVGEVSPLSEFTGEAKLGDINAFVLARIAKPNYFRLSGTRPDFGSAVTEGDDKSVVVSNTVLRLMNLPEDVSSLGKEITLKIFLQDSVNPDVKVIDLPGLFKIKGIITDDLQPPFVVVPAGAMLEKAPFYQRIFVKAKDIDKVEPLRDKLIEKGFLISARVDLVNQAKKIMTIVTVILGTFGIAAMVVSAIGMFNTMIIGFMERIFEVGIMKSIGASTQDIRNLFLMESLIMGLMGGVGGIAVGVIGGELFNLGLNFLAGYLGGQPLKIFIYPAQFLILIILLSGAVGILSGFWPARRAAQLSPKQAFVRK